MKRENALYIVATPIGNLEDMTARAVNVLRNVDVIAAEDTRHSGKLLQAHGISTPLVSYHDHGAELQTRRLLDRLADNQSVALISDAGTPLISDPGYRLVHEARAAGFRVVPIPGACALVAALCASGLPSDRFSFEGFPPAKSGARTKVFSALADEARTLIFYESPHRIEDSLADMVAAFGADRRAVLARELTKNFETFISGTLADLAAAVAGDANQRRGEMVVMVAARPGLDAERELSEEGLRVLAILLDELPIKQAAALAARISGEKKNKLYQWALAQRDA